MNKSKTITIWTDGTWKIWQSRDAELAANDDNWLLNILCSELDLIKELQTEVDELALENAAQQQVLGENTGKRVFRYGHRGDVMVHSCDKHPSLGFTTICCGCLTDYNKAAAEFERVKSAYDVRYNDLRRALEKNETLLSTIDGYEGAILEPLEEQYKDVCEQNVELQGKLADTEADLLKHRWIPVEEGLPEETKEDLRPQFLVLTDDGPAVQEWRHYSFGWEFSGETGKPTHYQYVILPKGE